MDLAGLSRPCLALFGLDRKLGTPGSQPCHPHSTLSLDSMEQSTALLKEENKELAHVSITRRPCLSTGPAAKHTDTLQGEVGGE